MEIDNENQTLIKEKWIHSLAEVVIEKPEVDIIEKKIARKNNKEVVRVVEEMKKVEFKILRGDKYNMKEDLVLKKKKVCYNLSKDLSKNEE